MKECSTCLTLKPIGDFYVHAKMRDGHLNKCKVCVRGRVANHRNLNIDRIRAYDIEREKLPSRAASAGRCRASYRERYPERVRASQLVNNAIAAGKMIRGDTCQRCSCSNRRLEAHHEDYSKPLEVVWLCKPCHYKADKERKF